MPYEENGMTFDENWTCDQYGIWTLPCLVFGHRAEFHINTKISEEEVRKRIEKMTAGFFLRYGSSIVFDMSAYDLWRSQVEQGRSFEKFYCFTDMHQVLTDVVKKNKLEEKIPFPKILLIDTFILQKAIDSFVGEERVRKVTQDLDKLINEMRERLQAIAELKKKQG